MNASTLSIALGLATIFLAGETDANIFSLGGVRNPGTGQWTGLGSLETVIVGNPSNAPDARVLQDGTTGYGSVEYQFTIGRYPVTAGQYCVFLNAVAQADDYGLYSLDMDATLNPLGCNIQRIGTSGAYTYTITNAWANRPVNYVSYWDACRFANWLTNGQPPAPAGPGVTETGVYTLNGYNGPDGRMIQRNAMQQPLAWAVTSENEYYKAAFYDPTVPGYWLYATRSNAAPSNVLSATGTNNANYRVQPGDIDTIGAPYYRTEVGAFAASPSAYGSFDQSGNVFEWTETVLITAGGVASRILKAGGFEMSFAGLQASYRYPWNPTSQTASVGFRVAQVPVDRLPNVSAGADVSAYENRPVTLHATASDPDGDSLTFTWNQIGGKSVTITGVNTDTILLTTPAVSTQAEAVMVFQVKVSDGRGGTASSSVTVHVYKAGDINHDNYVNVEDLLVLAAAWGSQAGLPPSATWNAAADINSDGTVNVIDLLILADNWGRTLH